MIKKNGIHFLTLQQLSAEIKIKFMIPEIQNLISEEIPVCPKGYSETLGHRFLSLDGR